MHLVAEYPYFITFSGWEPALITMIFHSAKHLGYSCAEGLGIINYTVFESDIFSSLVSCGFLQAETLLLRAEKRGLCDCFRAIHWIDRWDLANEHLFVFKMLFNKLQEDTECKLCHTARKRTFIPTGTAQLGHFCFDVFYHYCVQYCICWNGNGGNSAKVSLMGFMQG